MPTLSACIRKAGKALNGADADAIREIAREYLGDGMTNSEAATAAINDYLGILQGERQDIVSQVAQAGGDIAPFRPGVRTTIREQERTGRLDELRREAAAQEQAREDAAAEIRARETARLNQPKVRYGLNDNDIDQVNSEPRDPESVGTKGQMTMEEMSKREGDQNVYGAVKTAASDVADAAATKGRRATLSLSPTRNLVQFMPQQMRGIGGEINRLNKLMDGREASLTGRVREIIDPWMKLQGKNREESDLLTGVMHRSTLAQVDPSKETYTPRVDREKITARLARLDDMLASPDTKQPMRVKREHDRLMRQLQEDVTRENDHGRLRAIYTTMSPEAQGVFTDIRDMFRSQYNELQESMATRIETLEADEQTKQALRATMEKTFESGRVDPYFPLSRYGDFWAVAKDGDEVVAYSQFDKRSEWRQWQENMKAKGYAVDGRKDTKAGRSGGGPKIEAMDPNATLAITKQIQGLPQTPETVALVDDIWQTYLRSLPEMSARKQFIHRKGVMGFTADGLRSVADASLRNARRIAKVEYQYQIENQLRDLDAAAATVPYEQDPWAQEVADEVRQRHEWAMDHVTNPTATVLTSLGYHNYLGMLRPSAAIVNLTQNVLVGLPTLSAFAAGKPGSSFIEMSKAGRDVATLTQFAADPFADPEAGKRFSADEVKAMKAFEDQYALVDRTRTNDLIGVQEAGGKHLTSNWHKAAEISGWLFHNTEVYNRKVASLAAYRLARKQGMNHEDSVYRAVQLTEDIHFDYSSKNRPRLMQSDIARVALLFRNYSVNMYSYLIRNFHDAHFGQGTKAERKEAQRRFYGVMGMTTALAGASGVPFAWAVAQALDGVWEWLDDDEQEEMTELMDPKTRMRLTIKELSDVWGDEAAAIIMDGGIDGMMYAIRENTDLDVPNPTFSTRLTMANVAFQDAPADAPIGSAEWYAHYAGEVVGPSLGLIQDYSTAAYDIAKGNQRAWEKVAPSTMTDIMKTYRYMMDGVKNSAGATVLEPGELTAMDYATQLAGFTPYPVTRQYEENRARTTVDHKLEWRRSFLADQFKNAVRFEDSNPDLMDEALTEIDNFNANYPEYAIKVGDLQKGVLGIDQRFLDGAPIRSRKRQEMLRDIELTE